MRFPFWLGLALAAVSGFIALAYEIVWTRLFDFMSGSVAEAFGTMLASYLLGLAIGSLWSRRWQREAPGGGQFYLLVLSRLVIVSNVVGFLRCISRQRHRPRWWVGKLALFGQHPRRELGRFCGIVPPSGESRFVRFRQSGGAAEPGFGARYSGGVPIAQGSA